MTYFIAEIGQNHNGSLHTAVELIDMVSEPIEFENNLMHAANAVKFTVRDLDHECSPDQWNSEYNSPHAFGKTYGEHRKFLELGYENIEKLRAHAKSRGLDFILTLCNPGVVDQYIHLADKVKIASRDAFNIPLFKKLAEYPEKKLIISFGMDRYSLLKTMKHVKNQYYILHCVSNYPTNYHQASLNNITKLKKAYNDQKSILRDKCLLQGVGYSDHTTGILAAPVAVAMGAQIIEKHVTLNRDAKGSDHKCSLGPEGFKRCLRDIRNTEHMVYGKIDKYRETKNTRSKIGRSLAVNKPIKEGHIIKESDLIMVSPGTGYAYAQSDFFIGKPAEKDYETNELLT